MINIKKKFSHQDFDWIILWLDTNPIVCVVPIPVGLPACTIKVRLYFCHNVCLCFTFPSTSTLGGGDIKGWLYYSSVEVLTCYTSLLYMDYAPSPPHYRRYIMYLRLTYFWVNKPYILARKEDNDVSRENLFAFVWR